MAQAKKKTATKTAKQVSSAKTSTASKTNCKSKTCSKRKAGGEGLSHNMFFVITMSFLAATLLFANLIMMI